MRMHAIRRLSALALLAGVLTPIVGSIGVVPAHAANLVVTDGGDTGAAGQLRQVVAAAAPGDVITFRVPTVTLTTGSILINKNNLTIRGNGPAATTVTRAGGGSFSIFVVPDGATATIDLLTISNGSSPTGGGVRNLGTLTLQRSSVTANAATDGGGIYNAGSLTVLNSEVFANTVSGGVPFSQGAGVYSVGTLTVANSAVRDNTATGAPFTQGGGIFSEGTLTVLESIVSGNKVNATQQSLGGGIGARNSWSISNSIIRNNDTASNGLGGGLVLEGGGTVERTEVTGNTASLAGGGIRVAIATATLTNVTLAANSAQRGGAMTSSNSAVSLRNSTVSANTTTGGSALQVLSGGPITVQSSIVANQTAGSNCGNVIDGGNNLQFGDATCPFPVGDPLLGALANNGGISQTMAITNGASPAVNAGSNCAAATTDQRGFPRVGQCDIGAFEFGSTLADATPPACAIVGILAANPKQMDVGVQDTGRGLQTISGISITNGTVVVPYFTPGTTLQSKIAAVKTNQAASTTWSFHAIDQAGNDKLCI